MHPGSEQERIGVYSFDETAIPCPTITPLISSNIVSYFGSGFDADRFPITPLRPLGKHCAATRGYRAAGEGGILPEEAQAIQKNRLFSRSGECVLAGSRQGAFPAY